MNISVNKKSILCVLMILMLSFPVFCAENLIKNPGLEKSSGTIPENWDTWEFFKGNAKFDIETTDVYEGKHSFSITCDTENDARLIQEVQVKENTYYKISAWVKTVNVGTGFTGANISISDRMVISADLKGSNGKWEYLEWYILTGKGVNRIPIALGLGWYGNVNTGKVFFDDISMTGLSGEPPGAIAVLVEPLESKQVTDAGRSDMKTGQVNIVPVILAIVTIVLACVVIALLIVLGLKFRVHEKLPGILGNKISSFFSQPDTTDLHGIRKFMSLPYVRIVIFLVVFVILGLPFFLDIAESVKIEPYPGNENHYVYLSKAIMNGKLSLPHHLHDTAYFKGKYYVIYPPFPVLFVFPFVLLFGMKTKVTLIGIALALVSCILLYRILIKVKVDSKYRPWILLAFFLGTAYWLCLRNSVGVCWFAHVVSVFAGLLAIHEVLGRGNGILTGLFLGFAFLSRQLMIFFFPFFITAIWVSDKNQDLKKKIFHIAGFFAGLAVCVVIYLVYNYVRFGNMFDTGYSYLQLSGFMADRTNRYGQFSFAYIPFNFVYTFIQGFHINYGDWPTWVNSVHEWWPTDPFGTSITFASPFIIYAVWAKWKKSLLVSAWVSIIIVLIGTLAYYNNGWVQYNAQRFTLDFFPLLIVLIALGIQHSKKPFWKGFILVAVILNAITMLIIPAAG